MPIPSSLPVDPPPASASPSAALPTGAPPFPGKFEKLSWAENGGSEKGELGEKGEGFPSPGPPGEV